MRKIQINKKDISEVDISSLKDIYPEPTLKSTFDLPPGQSEYKLYAYLSQFFNNTTILEIGTGYGASALSFSHNPRNLVITYDMRELYTHSIIQRANLLFRHGDFRDDDIAYENIDLIMIDVDPHDGIKEPPMIEFLDRRWSGLLLLDDISQGIWPEMYKMWVDLPYEKYDLTDIGHFSGTGLLNIGDKFIVEVI